MKRLVAAGLVAIAAGVGLVLGLAWLAARSLVMPVRRPLPRTPADLGLTFESLELSGVDGIRLASWWIAADRPRATAVLVHGFRSTRNELLDHVPSLHALGVDVVLYDARACGQSGGALSTMGWREQEDLRAVIDQVFSRSEGRPVVVMGHSLGAATAILEGADDARVIAFVLEAPFTAIDDVVGRSFRHFTRPHLPAFPFAPLAVRLAEARVGQHRSAVRPVDVIERLAPRPVLLVSGGHDAFVTPADARRLVDRAGSSCTWWLIEEAGHPGGANDPFKIAPDEYQRRVADLVERALAQGQ
ncbi:MAG TPA: alpha/beta fold hydrolase [Candidatus Limnocylindrales bacterium]|jgi:alpha-beta hydrolase superfamily lysophospholipase